jgi:hypothetical protein
MTELESQTIQKQVRENPWRDAYWFARMLINNDKYGAVGKDSKMLALMAAELRLILQDKTRSADTQLALCKNLIRSMIETRYAKAKTLLSRIKVFSDNLDRKLDSLEGVAVFVLTAESIMIPINNAMTGIPSNDREYTEARAKAYLDELGEGGLATVVNIWDDFGVEGCLNAERVAVVREFARLRRDIADMPEVETDLVLTAFTQEFERRLGQKRKGRAGGSLEDVTSFLFNYYGIKATHAPDHFQADIEVDKWVRCSDGWLIGISCKRTLRERWKQVSSADRGVLSRFKIKELWHMLTYDEDLSDDKIVSLGEQGHVFYLRDDSRKLQKASTHVGMKNYVRPMGHFIQDLKKQQTIETAGS